MQELLVVEVIPREKGRTSIRFDNGMEVLLYKGEVRKLSLREGTVISREKYDEIIYEILGTRAKKRAMFLLERMDRTEHQLRGEADARTGILSVRGSCSGVCQKISLYR